MNAYRIDDQTDNPMAYFGTRDEAHQVAKQRTWQPEDQRIELVDVQTDKPGIVSLLNGKPIITEVLRTWALTPRKGIKEVPNGE